MSGSGTDKTKTGVELAGPAVIIAEGVTEGLIERAAVRS